MISLDDPKWKTFKGGYRIPFDASIPLKLLQQNENDEGAWKVLWENLHHQGDVDVASYTAVPHLVRLHLTKASTNWQFLGMVATIETSRWNGKNPEIPPELRDDYKNALIDAQSIGLERMKVVGTNEYLISCFSLMATLQGRKELARAILLLEEDIIEELLKSY